jgi:hypothetical protein
MTEILERLVAAGIELLPAPEVTTHFIFTRDGFVALVERRGAAFGGIGSAGLLAERGLAPLVQRGSQSFFVGRGFEQEATPEQIGKLKQFSSDLKLALGQS